MRARGGPAGNKQSLEVDWRHLVSWSVKLAMAVVDAPKVVLDILHATAKEVVLEDFPEFGNIHQDVFVRFPELSFVESIRNLRRATSSPFPCSQLFKLLAVFYAGTGRIASTGGCLT